MNRRLEECGLELHPKKTKIVYCKTATRKGVYPEWVFTFLGYAFGPRIARKAGGELWLSFGPAISAAAAKQIRQTIRGWRLRRRPRSSIEDLAFWINPVLRGWIQ